jgi:hypothetical protein
VIPEESNLLSGLLEGDGRRFHSSPISRNGMPPKTAIRTGVSVWRRSTAAIIHATAVALSPESEEVSEIATSTRLSKEYPPRTAIHGAGCGADLVCGGAKASIDAPNMSTKTRRRVIPGTSSRCSTGSSIPVRQPYNGSQSGTPSVMCEEVPPPSQCIPRWV